MVAPVVAGAAKLAVVAVSKAARRRFIRWAVGFAGGLLALVCAPLAMFVVTIFLTLGGGNVTAPPPVPGVGPAVTGAWAVPVNNYTLSDGFGPRESVPGCDSCSTWHRGQDFAAACEKPVYAASEGTVTTTDYQGTYGYMVKIDHGGGIETLYAHLTEGSYLVGVGVTVTTGQQIAAVGTTGGSTGCHLHLEVRSNGERIDPIPFYQDLNIAL